MKDQMAIATESGKETVSVEASEDGKIENRFKDIYDSIARRAYEIFETEGRQSGHDLEHWFKAEAETLHQRHFQITENERAFIVRAEVPGFSTEDLEVRLEPQRFVISAKREANEEHKGGGSVILSEHCASKLLRVLDLPSRIETKKAEAILKNGVLELRLPKAAIAKEPARKAQIA
ncbi:MAG: Hsp20 family protein [Candidatus Acidiferrales bacterium]